MSSYHIPNITIKEFRGIRKLSLQDLGKVNIITGENGSGTTSVLEAIHLYTGGASPEIVKEIIDSRAESPGQHRGNGESLTDFLALNSMFWGFPQAPHSPDPISITTGRKMPPHVVQMQLKLLTEITDDHRMRKLVQSQPNPAVDPQDVPALVVDTDEGTKNLPLTTIFGTSRQKIRERFSPHHRDSPTSIFLGPHQRRDPNMWDLVALTENEKYIKKALNIIEDRITGFSMIGDDNSNQARTTVAPMTERSRPVPLRSLGEGINRCYDITVAAVNVPWGILLIDQVENGLSPNVQTDLWRTLFAIARRRDVQIFASTHSIEAVQAFQRAAAESSEDFRCIQLKVSRDNHDQSVHTAQEVPGPAFQSTQAAHE